MIAVRLWSGIGRRASWRSTPQKPNERGQSLSVFAIMIMAALILVAGLVIDGGQQLAAASRAESVAAGAARAAGNRAALGAIGGMRDINGSESAARNYLEGEPGVTGTVSVRGGVIVVITSARLPTIFLSVIGIDQVTGKGEASVSIVATEAGE